MISVQFLSQAAPHIIRVIDSVVAFLAYVKFNPSSSQVSLCVNCHCNGNEIRAILNSICRTIILNIALLNNETECRVYTKITTKQKAHIRIHISRCIHRAGRVLVDKCANVGEL